MKVRFASAIDILRVLLHLSGCRAHRSQTHPCWLRLTERRRFVLCPSGLSFRLLTCDENLADVGCII